MADNWRFKNIHTEILKMLALNCGDYADLYHQLMFLVPLRDDEWDCAISVTQRAKYTW